MPTLVPPAAATSVATTCVGSYIIALGIYAEQMASKHIRAKPRCGAFCSASD
jgi:hypothetical protein